MPNLPKTPDSLKQPIEYELPKWTIAISAIVLTILFIAVALALGVQYKIPNAPLSNTVALIFAVAGSVYLHESAHYVVSDYLGLEPEFVWPTFVKFGVDMLHTKKTVASLLAPQLLSVLYVAIIYIGIESILEVMLVWALAVNLMPGAKDLAWSIRRLTWPKGTVIILQNSKNHVAFPKE